MLGKTVVGERVWDVMRGIDLLQEQPEVDAGRIACMGNSGGGTVTFYAACLEERIGLAVPSCMFCTYADSIMRIRHCGDNYLPGMLRVAEIGDLAGLIAPRRLRRAHPPRRRPERASFLRGSGLAAHPRDDAVGLAPPDFHAIMAFHRVTPAGEGPDVRHGQIRSLAEPGAP